MEYEWVAGRFVGDMAKTVRSHAKHGVGYYILGEDFDEAYVTAAFKRPLNQARPQHLTPITDPREIRKLEKRSNPLEKDEDDGTL